jgi:hypothetical protein
MVIEAGSAVIGGDEPDLPFEDVEPAQLDSIATPGVCSARPSLSSAAQQSLTLSASLSPP